MFELVVISGKGGTGKTTITASLASTGPKKVVADCDVDAADLHMLLAPQHTQKTDFYSGFIAEISPEQCINCGLCAQKCRFDAIAMKKTGAVVRREHCEGCGLCEIVCPADAVSMQERRCGEWYVSRTQVGTMVHAALGIGEENSGKLVTTVRKASSDVAREVGVETVLTDGPPGIGCPVIASLTNASMALLVTEPALPAMHDLQRVVELTKHFRVPAAVLINKADVNSVIAGQLKAWCAETGIPVVAEVNWHSDISKAQLAGKSLVDFNPTEWRTFFEDVWTRLSEVAKCYEFVA